MKKNTKKIIFWMLALGIIWGIGSTAYEKITGKKIESVSSDSCVDSKKDSDKKQKEVKPTDLKLEDYIKQKSSVQVLEVNNAIKENKYLLVKFKNNVDSKKYIAHNCYHFLKDLKEHKDYKKLDKIGIIIMSDFKDKYGNVSEDKIFQGEFKRSELDKINWSNFTFKDILEVAEETWFHRCIE